MKKNNYSKTIFIVMACVSLFSPVALAGDLYWGTSGIWNSGTLWFADAARTTPSAWISGSFAHFDQAATITGPNAGITIGGIVANENLTVTAGNHLNTGNVPVSFYVASGKLLDFGTQGLITTAGTTHGIIKDGDGALAITGNLYLGGFTLNAGTVTAKGANAFGAGILTINGGTIGAGAGYTYAAKGVNIRGNFTIGGVSAGGGVASPAFTFAATAPVSLGSANRTITMGGTGIVTFSGNMTGDAGVGLTLSSTITSGTALSPLKLVGDNIGYQGVTTINAYTMLKLGSASALGTTDAGTVVNSGGTLDIFGTNYTTAEPVTLKGSSTFAAISNTTGVATFNGPITLENSAYVNGAGGVLNLTNTIGGNGTLYLAGVSGGSISGIISVNNGLWVNNGTWTISGSNTYSGATTINATKTLILGASGTIPDESELVLNGTFKTGATIGFSESLGTLKINDNSTIALGTGIHTLTFTNSSAVSWIADKVLTITGWTGSTAEGSTAGKIFVGSDNTGLTATQLSQITFEGHGAGAKILSTGEIIPLDLTTVLDNSELQSINVSINLDGALAIQGLEKSTILSVYNTNGMLLVSKLINTTDASIILNHKGMYIVKLADKTFKVVR
jgi:hypothetical protein